MGEPPDVRWIVLHMIEETARHAGHLDIARELLGRIPAGGACRLPRRTIVQLAVTASKTSHELGCQGPGGPRSPAARVCAGARQCQGSPAGGLRPAL